MNGGANRRPATHPQRPQHTRLLTLLTLLLLTFALAFAGCSTSQGDGSDQGGGSSEGGAGGGGDTTLSIAAASSLTEAFDTLASDFEADHPGVTVEPVYESSGTAVDQVVGGAPLDVLATADGETMLRAEDEKAVSDPQSFATNTMVLVTPPDNPGGISDFSDVASDAVSLVVCDPSAPCGDVANTLLDENGVDATPASLEPDVKSVLTKVTEGEADAGMVYVTDAMAAGDSVRTIQIPGAKSARTPYFIGVVAGSRHTDLAQEWVDLVVSSRGQEVLADAGFGGPR